VSLRQLSFRGLWRDARGTMAVETVLVAPVLAMLALGTFDTVNIITKQQHLQSGASEAMEIVLASANGSGVSSTTLHDILVSSLKLNSNQVQITQLFRCDAAATTTTNSSTCTDTTKPIYQYVKLTLTDSYTPLWTSFGVGHTISYNVVRTVQTA
jgi:Flp pilus assembly protein TadG